MLRQSEPYNRPFFLSVSNLLRGNFRVVVAIAQFRSLIVKERFEKHLEHLRPLVVEGS